MTTHSSIPPQGARGNFDAGSLSWVMGEIHEALNRSKAAIVDAVAQDADARSTTLRQAKASLHQAHGALQIVDIDGVAIITETTEDLLDRLESGQIALTDTVAQVIGNAYQALVEYLEELLSGASHQPVRLFPYYKALLELRSAERIHPADLFFPNLAIRPQLPPIDAAAFSEAIDFASMRQRFEKALLPFLRSNDPAAETANAGAMRDIIVQVERLQSNQPSRSFWWVLHAFAEAVAAGQIQKEIYVKQLFARINLQIRRLSDGSASIAERLLRDALFFIARIEQPLPRAVQVRDAYQLNGLVPVDYDRKRYGQVNADALALARTRLSQAKNLWSRIAAGDASVAEGFGTEMKGLTEAVSKLGSLPLLKLMRELNGIARHVAATAQSGSGLALEMATSLLFVENALANISRLNDDFPQRADAMTARLLSIVEGELPAESSPWLDDMSRQAQQRQTMAVLAGEMQNSLRQVEKLLDDYFREPTERAALSQIGPILHQITGALAILDQNDALRAVQHTQSAVQAFADGAADAAPDVQAFQHVAQNIGALSFFIETLQLQPENAKNRFSFDEQQGLFRANLVERHGAAEADAGQDVFIPALEQPGIALPLTSAASPSAMQQEPGLQQPQPAEHARYLSAEPTGTRLLETLNESVELVQMHATPADQPQAAGYNHLTLEMLDSVPAGHTPDQPAAATAVIQAVPVAAPASAAADMSDEAVDAELLEIFLLEAEEVLDCINATVPLLRDAPHNQEYLTTLRRSFHTLKGSGRMVGLTAFGDAAWSIEQVLNLKLAEAHEGDADLCGLLEKASELLSAWVADLQAQGRSDCRAHLLITAAERVKNGAPFFYEQDSSDAAETPVAPLQEEVPLVLAGDPAIALPEHAAAGLQPEMSLSYGALLPEEQILATSLPGAEAADHGADGSYLIAADAELAPADGPDYLENVLPDASIDDALTIAEPVLADAMPDAYPVDMPAASNLVAGIAIPQPVPVAAVIEFPTMQAPAFALDDGVKYIGDLEISVPLHNIYLAETDELVRMLAQDMAEWRHEPDREVNILAVHAVHSLAGSSATVGFKSLQEVAHGLEMLLQCLSRKAVKLTAAEFDILDSSIARLKSMLQMFALGEMPEREPAQVQLLSQLQQTLENRAAALQEARYGTASSQVDRADADDLRVAAMPIEPTLAELEAQELLEASACLSSNNQLPAPTVDAGLPAALPEAQTSFAAESVLPAPGIQGAPLDPAGTAEDMGASSSGISFKDELDADLLPVFLEEGRDMLPEIGEKLRAWQQNMTDASLPQALLRLLHTVKGSARMAGAMALGQHMHELETRIETIMHSGLPSAQAIEDLLARYDYGLHLFEVLQNPQAAKAAPVAGNDGNGPGNVESANPGAGLVELNAVMPVRAADAVTGVPGLAAQKAVAAAGAMPLVRVRADILDRMVNQAGEVSISRSKLENEVGTLRNSLSELTENVSRLRVQLREIEMQAESQISSRMSLTGERDFDPLEFDRFTRLQELTRMMAESVNDVGSVQQNLARTVDNASIDLLMQARLTRDLQQDLMRVRMVQFASISERLYRVTRQASKELDKRVNLDIHGSAVEMDRSVLERMAGPFEHLLRNAIVHGIEPREKRRAANKSEIGELLIEIRQEGNEVVIQFSDDGQGLNIDRIREKAQVSGLLSDDMSESEVTDLIFHPGFTTADAVTELAGRGVGMDVVRSEATALGGRVAIKTEPGKGAQFTIHLPLTLAVTQVVVLSTGGKTYAVPSVLVEQVQQLKTNMLAAAYNDGAVMWQGQRVPMHYLATLLGDRDATAVAQQYTPLVIMKSGSDRVALHVDEIVGNREVVVKNIGPQLSRMIGIAGATVLGSGEIVLILNPLPLAQRAAHENLRAPRLMASNAPEHMGAVAEMIVSKPALPQSDTVQGLRTQNIIMVVDDSLTVRRVTQRLLVREGYQVILAKDGVDALEQLQAITPDVMLVDIEMPRMDGFDLTRNVRGDERTRHIPIIMITSRTATKHRNYAMELGVNEYLGKPYQEDDLLKSIAEFIAREATAR